MQTTTAASQGAVNPVGFLSMNNAGFVFWKGTEVEHFSHQDPDKRAAALQRLAYRCQALEDKGFPVNSRSAISPLFADAPAGTPWLLAMRRYYALFEGQGRRVAVFYHPTARGTVVLERHPETKQLTATPYDSAYAAYEALQDQGLESKGPWDRYERFADFFAQAALTPADVEQALAVQAEQVSA
jgi:hypothetical protein